jgi:hypothetical protein
MPARRCNGIIDAEPPGSSHAYGIALHAWLRNQVLKRCVNVASFRQPCRFVGFAAAFAEPEHIQRERVEPGFRKLRR